MNIEKTGMYVIGVIFALLLLFPVFIMFKMSVSAPADIFQDRPPFWIEHFTWEHFRRMLSSGEAFYGPLGKSLVTAALSTLLSLLLAAPAAYAIARFNLKLRSFFIFLIFVSRMVPEVSIAMPISVVFLKAGLLDTTLGLVLAHLVKTLPVSCFILISVFGELPSSLEKQAWMDGCSRLEAIHKVVLPLVLRGLVVAALFAFMLSWDEFIYASYLTLGEVTMPLKMYYYVSRGNVFYAATYAVVITLPVLIITGALQRYIKAEYLSGAVKG